MKFYNQEDEKKELTYSDVFLYPQYSDINSRMSVNLTPNEGIGTTIPLIVANMMAVAGKRMTETVARRGGLVVLPQDYSLEKIKEIIEYTKNRHHIYETPVVLPDSESLQTALNLIYKRSHGAIVVVDDNYYPVGIFTEKDAFRKDKFSSLKDVMTTDLICIKSNTTQQNAFNILEKNRISFAPVVDKEGKLLGALTKKGILRSEIYQPATNQKNEFLTAVAVGANHNSIQKVKDLLNIGVDIIVLDTAHGHQKRMLESIKEIKKVIGTRPLAAGNIVTVSAAKDLIEAGADILKVGVGPGAMCTTRMMTGVGRPQFTAVNKVANFAREKGVHVWADGGIRSPRDVALALAAGASSVFIGSWWAGTYESPADIQTDEIGNKYKENFGMASRRAVKNRNSSIDTYSQAKKQYFEEGISSSKMYLKEGQSSAEDIIDNIISGLRSTCTYTGACNLQELYEKALIGVQTSAGYTEGTPHGKIW